MNKRFLSLCTAALVCASSIAQEGEIDSSQVKNNSFSLQKLDEVVVSDSRFKLKRENSGKTIIKITSEELNRNQGKTIAEIINTKSGIEIVGSRGRQGTILGVFARGGRGRQVLIVIDGVRVSDPSSFSSEYDLRLLSAATIASIEIIKGAASTLYGPSAATAVVNIITKKASDKKIAMNIQSSMGTNQTTEDQNFNGSDFSNNAQIGGTLNGFTYTVGFAQTYSDGLSAIITPNNDEDAFSSSTADLRLGYRFSEKFDFAVYGNQAKIATDFDESFGLVDAPYEFLSKQERYGLASSFAYSESGSLQINLARTTYESESRSAFPNAFTGENTVLDAYNKYNFDNAFHTILGLNYILDKADFSALEQFEIIDPYVNVVYISPTGFNLNLGARLNNHSEYGTNFVYNLNPSFSFKTEKGYFKLMGSFATSYITPSLTQLFGNFGANADLQPEDNRTIEGGFEYALTNKLRAGALYFNRKEENFVFFDNATSTYENATNTIDAQGLEIELDWSATDDLKISSNYTFTERKGDNAIRIPKHKINATVSYRISDRFYTSFDYSLTGQRSDTDFSSFPFVDIPLESFSLVDFYVGFEMIPDTLRLFLNAANILNERYTEILGFTTKGRNVRIGFNLNL